MGLVTVTNIGDPLVNPSNVIAPFTKVTFTLKNLVTPDGIIVNINTNDVVEGEVRVLTDANGEFSVQLYPTDELSPQTTYVVSISGWGTFTAGLPSVNNTQYLIDWFTTGIPLTGGELSAFQNHITDTVVHLSSIEHEALTALLNTPVSLVNTISMIAPITLGGNRAVTVLGYADNLDSVTINKFIGVTNNAANSGSLVTVITNGEVSGFSGLIPNDSVYISTNGTLTYSVPSSGYIQKIGVVLNSTTILINNDLGIQVI
jgi:hypothetical protein